MNLLTGRVWWCILFTIVFPLAVAAQDGNAGAGLGIEVNPFSGKVIKHTKKFLPPVPDLTTGLEANVVFQTYGKKEWHQRRRFPVLGISAVYTNYGIDSVYGRCFGIAPNITLSLISGKRMEWTARIGNGVGYVTHKYGRRPLSDTLNNAIGSHINDFFIFNTDFRYHINQHLDVQAGITFTHISDASFHQPNLGVNMLGEHIGIRYFPVSRKPKYIIRNLPKLSNRILLQGRVAMAFTQSEAPLGPLYPVYMGSLYGSRRYRSKNKLLLGLDYSYHESVYAFLTNNIIFPGEERQRSYKLGAFVGNEFLLGRLGIVLQMGFYLKQAALKQDPYYQKLGGNYYLIQREKGVLKELCITGLLKTHKSIAELAEFGLGFGF